MITRFSLQFPFFLVSYILTIVIAKDNLPPCHQIPKLLCCTERVLDKCLSGCITYVTDKCPQKLHKFDKIPSSTAASPIDNDAAIWKILQNMEARTFSPPKESEKTTPRPRSAGVNLLEVPAASQSSEGFIEQSGRGDNSNKIVQISSAKGGASSSVDYARLNQQYPITEVTDGDLTSDCGTQNSRPPYSPCLSRKLVDEQFASCCKQHVPSNCYSLCTYEHREHVAAETLIQAVQQDACNLKYLSNILYCANRNRDNRKCCDFLGMAAPELGVGDRCLRMCNIGQSGDRVGTVERNDLVCLSNWNVLMYCARAGLRTIN